MKKPFAIAVLAISTGVLSLPVIATQNKIDNADLKAVSAQAKLTTSGSNPTLAYIYYGRFQRNQNYYNCGGCCYTDCCYTDCGGCYYPGYWSYNRYYYMKHGYYYNHRHLRYNHNHYR